MSHDDPNSRKTAADKLSTLDQLDLEWTDEAATEPHVPFPDDPSHRVTTVPEIPPEKLAKELMAMAQAAEDAAEGEDAEPAESSDDRPTPIVQFDPFSLEAGPLGSGNTMTLDDPALGFDDPDGVDVQFSYESIPPDLLDEELEEPLPGSIGDTIRDMKDRHAVGDFSGALDAAQAVLAMVPNHVDALRYADSCRETLTQMCTARIGGLDRCPCVTVPPERIRWLSLDHHAGFLLSLIDGTSTVEEVLDMSGMSRLDALRIVCDLMEQKVIALGPRR